MYAILSFEIKCLMYGLICCSSNELFLQLFPINAPPLPLLMLKIQQKNATEETSVAFYLQSIPEKKQQPSALSNAAVEFLQKRLQHLMMKGF